MTTRSRGSKPRTTSAQRLANGHRDVIYPESDGKPMAETDVHRDEMVRLIETLKSAFAERPDVYVSGNLFVYSEEGNPRRAVAPDVFVAFGATKAPPRRTYKLWEEGVPPTVVIEVTSASTRRVDVGHKSELYARLGVREYFLYDPLAEYLRPSLQGFVVAGATFLPMAHGAGGGYISEALSMSLMLVAGRLRLIDAATGRPVLSPSEQLAEVEARASSERAARHDLERRVGELETRLAGLEDRRT